jgi:hypothetical protein
MRTRIVSILLGVLAGVAATDAGHASDVKAWQAWIEKLGQTYLVDRGTIFEVDNAACRQFIAVFGTCFGNNAAAPYLVPVPPIDGTVIDPYYAGSFTMAGQSATPGKAGSPSNMFYRLAGGDALVVIMSPPPRLAYLGYQSYVFTRSAADYPASAADDATLSPDPSRYEILGSVGNDVNDVVVQNKIGSDSFWGGDPIVYVTTSDPKLADYIVSDAAASGLDAKRIFVEPVGANAKSGTTFAADDRITLLRYALPEDDTASSQWLSNLKSNMQVYRVALPPSRIAPPQYPTQSYTPKTGNNEANLAAPFDELSGLLAGWLKQHQSAGPTRTCDASQSDHVDKKHEPYGTLVGKDCIADGRSCLADNQDTDAYRTAVIGALMSGNLAIFTGVNHAVTDNASYLSLSVYNGQTTAGVASVSQTNRRAVGFYSGDMTGSAEAVLKSLGLYDSASPALKAALPKLYVEFFARECGARNHCVKIATADVPLGVPIAITQRAYVRPDSTTGANPDIMQGPRAIFQSRTTGCPAPKK